MSKGTGQFFAPSLAMTDFMLSLSVNKILLSYHRNDTSCGFTVYRYRYRTPANSERCYQPVGVD